ncbi:MAG: hypothetical protein H8E98_05605 [Bacteroidetes bacterium]|nr:hypothetical protein [Bacteroidota bacterium]
MVDFIKLHSKPLEYYIDLLRNDIKFSLTRWGDGEWNCAMGVTGRNCDKHEYFPAMSTQLVAALIHDKGYFKSTWPLSEEMIGNNIKKIRRFCEGIGINLIGWEDASVIENSATNGDIIRMVDQLEKMNFVIVSEPRKRKLPIKYTDFIEVSPTNCYLEKDRIREDIIDMVNYGYNDIVFGFSASMATNVIIDELYPIVGKDCWMIDFGSIWDPFIGITSRSYHRNYVKNTL